MFFRGTEMIGFCRVASRALLFSSALIVLMGALDASGDTLSTPPDCKDKVKPVTSCNRSIQPRCYCPPSVTIIPGVGGQGDSTKNDTDSSKKVDQIAKIADMTLKGVADHSDLVTTLWKVLVGIATLTAGILTFLGYDNSQNVKKSKAAYDDLLRDSTAKFEKITEDYEKIKAYNDKFTKQTVADHRVMMFSNRAAIKVELAVDLLEKAKLLDKAKPSEAKEAAELTDNANRKFVAAKNEIKEVLKDNEPIDPAVGSWTYSLYGYTQYKTDELNSALASAKKSLGFSMANETALYNAACYAAKLQLSQESIEYLKLAVKLNPDNLTDAKGDADFDAIRKSQAYNDFVGT